MPTCAFLSEKSTLFVVSGFAAQCCGPAFFVCGEAAESNVSGGRLAGRGRQRGWRANDCGQSNTRGATRERCVEKGKKVIFLFLEEKIGRCFLYLLGGDSSRSAAIAALGYRHRREKRCAVAALGEKTQLVEG